MLYSVIGILAALILIIENQDILFRSLDIFASPSWKAYRRFLFAVLVYYVTDALWGIIENYKLAKLLFTDTTVYFVAMAAGILLWTQYIVVYLEERSRFARFLLLSGRVLSVLVALLAIVNIFVPVLFTVDDASVYVALPVRYVILGLQILLLLLVSIYTLFIYFQNRQDRKVKYRTPAFFGFIMAVFLFAQLFFPYLPLYAIAYLLGTCLLRALVLSDEKKVSQLELAHAAQIAVLQQSIRALLDNMPCLSFSKDAKTGIYLACNQAFAEYAHKDDPSGVIGLTDAQIFDPVTARHFVEDDRMALSMEQPYIFYEDVPDAAGNPRQFQTTKIKYYDDTGRLCTLGMCEDVTEQVKILRAEERLKEEQTAYKRINALTGDFLFVYVVDPETGSFREFSSSENHSSLRLPPEGEDFFEAVKDAGRKYVYPSDLERYLSVFSREDVLAEIQRSGIFAVSFRMLREGEPFYVRMKAALLEDTGGQKLVIGLNDIDAHVRQEKDYEDRIAQAQSEANIDALTGVKNRHAYLQVEEKMDLQITEHRQDPFAIIILDINDLKLTNDTAGHQAGDQLLKDASKVICGVFHHSPVFRVGGDEFVVIVRDEDYRHLEELMGKMRDHNHRALHSGGVVVACGMAKFANDRSVATVFERADQAMYENKANLKNQKQA